MKLHCSKKFRLICRLIKVKYIAVHIEKKETAVKEEGVDPVAVVEAAHAELDK